MHLLARVHSLVNIQTYIYTHTLTQVHTETHAYTQMHTDKDLRANKTWGILLWLADFRMMFKNLHKKSLRTLYVTYVRPVIKYSTSVWPPHLKRCMKLEKVQRFGIGLVPELRDALWGQVEGTELDSPGREDKRRHDYDVQNLRGIDRQNVVIKEDGIMVAQVKAENTVES